MRTYFEAPPVLRGRGSRMPVCLLIAAERLSELYPAADGGVVSADGTAD